MTRAEMIVRAVSIKLFCTCRVIRCFRGTCLFYIYITYVLVVYCIQSETRGEHSYLFHFVLLCNGFENDNFQLIKAVSVPHVSSYY